MLSSVDPWDSPQGSGNAPELERVLIQRIASQGPLTFAEFMASALYHPRHGYYTTAARRIGRDGDYITSPEVHAVFGGLVARQLVEFWELLGRPEALSLIEAGAGNGTLARDVLATLGRAALPVRWGYTIIEPHPAARSRQRETLAASEFATVRWAESLAALPPTPTPAVVLSNELLDAFPVHRVAVREGALHELYVNYEDGQFHDHEGPLSSPELERHFQKLGHLPGEGCSAEVNLGAPRWIAEAATCVSRGFLLAFDYGAPAAELYAPWRRDGTLLCFSHHAAGRDPYVRIGQQDLTAHVDFTAIARAGRDAGLETLGFAAQAEVLTALGIGEGLGAPGEGTLALEQYMQRRAAAVELLDSAGLGRIRVLVQGKGVGVPELRAFPHGADGLHAVESAPELPGKDAP